MKQLQHAAETSSWFSRTDSLLKSIFSALAEPARGRGGELKTSARSPVDHGLVLFTLTTLRGHARLLQQGKALGWLWDLEVPRFRKERGGQG